MLSLTKQEQYELWLFIKKSCDAGNIPQDIDANIIGTTCLKLEPLNTNDYPQ